MTILRILIGLLCVGLAQAAERQIFYCDNGSPLEISFSEESDGRPLAILHFADGEIRLPAIPAASGKRFRAQPITLNLQDESALIEDEQGNQRHCSTQPPSVRTAPAANANSSFISLNGQVRYVSRMALPDGAILRIRIFDLAHGKRQLAELSYELQDNQVPIPFSASLDRDLLRSRARLAARVEISLRGRTWFKTEKPHTLTLNGLNDIVLKAARP